MLSSSFRGTDSMAAFCRDDRYKVRNPTRCVGTRRIWSGSAKWTFEAAVSSGFRFREELSLTMTTHRLGCSVEIESVESSAVQEVRAERGRLIFPQGTPLFTAGCCRGILGIPDSLSTAVDTVLLYPFHPWSSPKITLVPGVGPTEMSTFFYGSGTSFFTTSYVRRSES